ncbi:unnamed protein product, partial [Staurois parvus]
MIPYFPGGPMSCQSAPESNDSWSGPADWLYPITAQSPVLTINT